MVAQRSIGRMGIAQEGKTNEKPTLIKPTTTTAGQKRTKAKCEWKSSECHTHVRYYPASALVVQAFREK